MMHPSQFILPGARLAFGLCDLLLKGVTPETFARKPAFGATVIDTNHPAFILGHLSMYPNRLSEILGITLAACALPDGFGDLFSAGKPCHDDVEGRIYPAMDSIVSFYQRAHLAMFEALPAVDASVFDRVNPNEKMRERFPTIGALSAFLLIGHPLMHLGQFSAWRRGMGLPSAT